MVLVIYPISHICPSGPIAYAMVWDCEQLHFAEEWLALLGWCWKVLLDALLGLRE